MHASSRFPMIAGAALCVAIVAFHVDDQGGVTALADPGWLGWGYRLLEVTALVVAGALLMSAGAGVGVPRIGAAASWAGAAAVGAGPFVGYLLTRTVGLPQDSDDIGNWADPLGTASLIVEAALILLGVAGLWRLRTVRSDVHARDHVLAA